LSLVDAQGQPKDGFLRLRDIFNLKLAADLVVLSACQTGIGKDIKGEGIVGLTRGFMYAGSKAPSVRNHRLHLGYRRAEGSGRRGHRTDGRQCGMSWWWRGLELFQFGKKAPCEPRMINFGYPGLMPLPSGPPTPVSVTIEAAP
jgi:CHAT domain